MRSWLAIAFALLLVTPSIGGEVAPVVDDGPAVIASETMTCGLFRRRCPPRPAPLPPAPPEVKPPPIEPTIIVQPPAEPEPEPSNIHWLLVAIAVVLAVVCFYRMESSE